jgi:YD repeat-containing protein
MLNKVAATVFMLSILFAAMSGHVLAQSNSCAAVVSCSWYSLNSGCLPILPKTVYACFTNGPWSAQCLAKTTVCAPAPKECHCNAPAGSPIDLATGDTYFDQADIRIPGLGGGLTLKRTWNSISFGTFTIFGGQWTSNFEESVYADPDGYLDYYRGDGSLWSFGFSGWDNNGNPNYAPAGPANQVATITQYDNPTPENPTWVLKFQNGEQRVFDGNSGKLLSITDRNGNATALNYDSSYRLTSVADPASRHLYFSYSSPSPFIVSNVTSDFGVSLSYAYDISGRLVQVTEPDSTTISYQYNDLNNPNLITAVLDSNGKVLESHTYNSCAQGLTSSRALGVDAITISYPLACNLGFLGIP